MPLYDEYAQQVPFPVQTDRANIRAWGEALVDSVVQRSVMRFPSRSVRGAVVTSPQPGMTTWIEDARAMEIYSGSAWVTLAAGTNAWANIPMHSAYPWSDGSGSVNNEMGRPQYRVVEMFGARSLMLRGGFGVTYPGSGLPNNRMINATPLPDSVWPSVRRVVPLATSVAGGADPTVKLDVDTDGYLRLYNMGPNNQPSWISLDGVNVSL